jgi:GMP synthase (glutamine-hydrolysing)
MQILLFDNGSKYLPELKILLEGYGEVMVSQDKDSLSRTPADLVVLSGGHHYAIMENPDNYKGEMNFIRSTNKPVLGICLGAEIIAYTFGAEITNLNFEIKGLKNIEILKNENEFDNLPNFWVYESHKWAITKLSGELIGLAKSECGYEIIKHITKPIYGFQFHPEMFEDKSCGDEIFKNLITNL